MLPLSTFNTAFCCYPHSGKFLPSPRVDDGRLLLITACCRHTYSGKFLPSPVLLTDNHNARPPSTATLIHLGSSPSLFFLLRIVEYYSPPHAAAIHIQHGILLLSSFR